MSTHGPELDPRRARVHVLPGARLPSYWGRHGRRLFRLTLPRLAGFLLGVAAVVLVLLTQHNLNHALPAIIADLEALTGRQVSVTGQFRPVLRWRPTLALDGLEFGAGDGVPGLAIRRLELGSSWLALLGGQRSVRSLQVRGVEMRVDLRPGAIDVPNAGPPVLPRFAQLEGLRRIDIRDLVVRRVDASTSTPLLALDRLTLKTGAVDRGAPLRLAASGARRGRPLHLAGAVDVLADWLGNERVDVDLHGALGGVPLDVRGNIAAPARLQGVDLLFTLAAEEAPAAAEQPVEVRARLHGNGSALLLERLPAPTAGQVQRALSRAPPVSPAAEQGDGCC